MFADLLHRVLLDKLSSYGRDASGNHILSDDSIEDVSKQVTLALASSLQRPSVTFSFNEVATLARESGFRAEPPKVASALPLVIYHPKSPGVDQTVEVNRLADAVTKLILTKVNQHTSVKDA